MEAAPIALTIAVYAVLLVMFIAAVLALIGLPIVMRWRSRYRAASERLTAEIAAEKAIRPFESGSYRGATAPDYPTVKNSGQIALTRRRIVFVTFTGKTIDVPLDRVTGVRTSKVFKGSAKDGWTHLVVAVEGGEVAFFVEDTTAWVEALTKAIGRAR